MRVYLEYYDTKCLFNSTLTAENLWKI